MGGRTHAGLARPKPTPRQGLGENHRKLQRLGLHRQHQTPLTQARKILLPNVNFWVGHLDVALDPGFAENRLVYLTYSEPREGGAATTADRGRMNTAGTALEGF